MQLYAGFPCKSGKKLNHDILGSLNYKASKLEFKDK
jgi:hypothetical protein